MKEEALRIFIREVTSRTTANGDCYEAAGKYMMDNCMMGGCSFTLVHAEVMGQASLEGVTFGHAWVLDRGTVIDRSNGRNLQLPKELYYALGQVDNIGNIHEYTWEEAKNKILAFEHWGPWELRTATGL